MNGVADNSAGLGLALAPSPLGLVDSKQCGIEKQMKYLIGAYFRKVSSGLNNSVVRLSDG